MKIFNQNKYIFFLTFYLVLSGCINESKTDREFNKIVESFTSKKNNFSKTSNRLSEEYIFSELSVVKNELNKLRSVLYEDLSNEEKVDYKFIESLLVGKEIQYEDIQSWKRDPRDYMNFRQISSTINGPRTCEEKIIFLTEYLPIIQEDLKSGSKQLVEYVPRFQELGLYMAKNSNVIFDEEINKFFESCSSITQDEKNQIKSISYQIINELKIFTDYIENILPDREESTFSIGKSTYNKMLKHQFLLEYDDETLWEFGWQEFNRTLDKMDALAKEIDSTKTTKELLIDIKNEYPDPYDMIEAHQYWVDNSGKHIKSKGLIPIPWKERVNVVAREEYLRKTSYYGNFSRSKGKDEEGYFTSEWKINPFEDYWDEKTKNEYLVEHDWGVIIVTAPHETYGGHHIQGLYQMHNPNKLRKNNGISLFSEGWGLYNEQLMLETGFYPNKKIKLRQLQLRLWRNARVIYDVGMHSEKLSYEEAISLMTDKVGFLRWAAQLEIDSSSSRPGYFIGYFIGMTEILKMREEFKKLMGENYDISDFHEKLLKVGNMPPSLMKESLFN
ncbi:MAG: DUF885 family protein [Pelagibacterales bacterium]|nr:DUF885 family protein [Pelagibacterales bacterium]